MRSSLNKVVAAVAVAIVAVAGMSSAGSAGTATSCSTRWGSLAESDSTMVAAPLQNVRAGRQACFDRLVFDIAGPRTGFHVEYVTQVTADGSGEPVPLRGGAFLQVVVRAPGHDDAGNPTYSPANRRELVDVSGFRTFRQVAFAGDFEGQTTFGLGVRARLPFRVFTLAGPGSGSRVVIDVAHTW